MLADDRFPRSSAYDPEWVLANQMGPNALWLTESLTNHMTLERGMRVVDMGCGTAMSSIFLAKEFGVQVWANDLWVSAEDNQQRIDEAGVADLVTPVRAEAHSLLYERAFFDAAISVDCFCLGAKRKWVFQKNDVERLRRTLLTKVMAGDTPADTVDGKGTTGKYASQIGRGLALAEGDPAVWNRVRAFFENQRPGDAPTGLLSLAELLRYRPR